MIEVTQIVKVKHVPLFNIDGNNERVCMMVLGKIRDIIFLVKVNEGKIVNAKSKKYLKKKDLSLIISEIENVNEIELTDRTDIVDLTNRSYEYSKEEIELKFNEMHEIFKNM